VSRAAGERLKTLYQGLNRPFAGVTALLVLGIMLSIVYDTTARLFFSAPTLWVLDANEYLLVYLTFVPAGWILTRGGHVRVEILVQRLSARRQRTMDLLGSLLGVITARSWPGRRG
jgi:TRAP-type C4-dicarboxylate transport system permease small subunit